MNQQFLIEGRVSMAAILGCTATGLYVMEQRGLPIQQRSRNSSEGHRYHLPSVITWLKEDQKRQLLSSTSGEGTKELLLRKTLADTRTAEIELAKLEETMIDVALLRRGLDGVIIHMRTILLGLPAHIGRDIDEPDLRAQVQRVVDRRVREALEEIARYDPLLATHDDRNGTSDDADPGEPEPDPSTTKAHDQPVGRATAVPQPRRRGVRPVAKRRGTVSDSDHGRGL